MGISTQSRRERMDVAADKYLYFTQPG